MSKSKQSRGSTWNVYSPESLFAGQMRSVGQLAFQQGSVGKLDSADRRELLFSDATFLELLWLGFTSCPRQNQQHWITTTDFISKQSAAR